MKTLPAILMAVCLMLTFSLFYTDSLFETVD